MKRDVTVTAAEVLLKDYIVPESLARDLRRADDFIQMAVIAASAAAEAAGGNFEPEKTGIFIGTAFGPLETNFESLGSLIDDGEGQISPTLFSHSVYNAAAGYVARLLDVRGPALTITNYGWPFLIALEEARAAVAAARIERAIVVGVETYSELLADAYRRSYNTEKVPWEKNAVAWVLDGSTTGGYCRLHGVSLVEAECDPADFLTRKGESLRGEGLPGKITAHSMAYADAMTRSLKKLSQGQCAWELTANFGRAEISMSV